MSITRMREKKSNTHQVHQTSLASTLPKPISHLLLHIPGPLLLNNRQRIILKHTQRLLLPLRLRLTIPRTPPAIAIAVFIVIIVPASIARWPIVIAGVTARRAAVKHVVIAVVAVAVIAVSTIPIAARFLATVAVAVVVVGVAVAWPAVGFVAF